MGVSTSLARRACRVAHGTGLPIFVDVARRYIAFARHELDKLEADLDRVRAGGHGVRVVARRPLKCQPCQGPIAAGDVILAIRHQSYVCATCLACAPKLSTEAM